MSVRAMSKEIEWRRIDRRIAFTWGGAGGEYVLHLRMTPGRNPVYAPLVYGLKSCYAAQQLAHRGNQALKMFMPHLLRDDAELPGVGFQYPEPEKVQ